MSKKKGAKYERELVNDIGKTVEGGDTKWVAQRGAASVGLCDVSLYTPHTEYFLVEVKFTESEDFYTSNKEDSQYANILELANMGFPYIYVLRWKSWNKQRGNPTIQKKEVFSPLWTDTFRINQGVNLKKLVDRMDEVEQEFDMTEFMRDRKICGEKI